MSSAKCIHCEGRGCTRCKPWLLHRTGCNCSDCRGDSELEREARELAKLHGDLAPTADELRREREGD